jgi:hypothetical protein
MKNIFKYHLALTEQQSISLPRDWDFLSLQVQHGEIVFWAAVDKNERAITYRFWILGTGMGIPEDLFYDIKFLGTVQLGNLVWHVYRQV